MAAQLTLLGDVPAWRPETGHMLYGPKPDLLSSMGSQTPSLVGHPDGAAPMASTHGCLWHAASGTLPWQDPLAVRNRAPELSRDRVRTPMPWASGPGVGFTTAARTWLPVGPRLDRDMVAVQRADPDSMASRVRDLLRARRELAAQADRPIE